MRHHSEVASKYGHIFVEVRKQSLSKRLSTNLKHIRDAVGLGREIPFLANVRFRQMSMSN
jgi:hypothetical protein